MTLFFNVYPLSLLIGGFIGIVSTWSLTETDVANNVRQSKRNRFLIGVGGCVAIWLMVTLSSQSRSFGEALIDFYILILAVLGFSLLIGAVGAAIDWWLEIRRKSQE